MLNRSTNQEPDRRRTTRPGCEPGFALVVVLIILVLMLLVVLAFFSRATISRMISGSSAANQQVGILAESAVEIVVSDLVHEIRAGSVEDSAFAVSAGGTRVFQPRLVDTPITQLGGGFSISAAASMMPQRVVANPDDVPTTLLKQSLRDRAFFDEGPGVLNDGLPAIPDRAADVNTEDPAKGGTRVGAEHWAKPGLAAPGQTIPPPDWVYLNRAGQTPTEFDASWGDRSPENSGFIIGRFAYNIYDVGGLIDINVVGNLLPASENVQRGRLHQVSLMSAPGALAIPDFDDFVTWRSSGDDSELREEGALFDPARTFMKVADGSQALVTRQDLLKYVESEGTIPEIALPFLTTFSRDLNAPIHAPEPNRPMLPAATPPDSTPQQLNPGLMTARFQSETTLSRGTGPEVTVAAGTPVMARRFPLSKLDLLADDSADPRDLAYYFGLDRQSDGSFRYTATSADGRIKRLDEVALESPAREPNFFEVLQATIITGSLGRNSGNTYTIDQPRDVLRNLQILQIGANIIDQWDADNHPVEIAYPSANPGEWLAFYGTENLPYINNFQFVGWRPEWDRNRFQVWMLFDVWNPHQNAQNLPTDIEEFRIIPVSGQLRLFLAYRIVTQGMPGVAANRELSNTAYNPAYGVMPNQDIEELNQGREFRFPNVSYEDPTVIGGLGKPTGADYDRGLLVIDYPNVPAAVPEDPATMSGTLRGEISDILEFYGRARLPPEGAGFFGAKPHNYMLIQGRPGDLANFALQYRRAGSSDWHTYQTVDDLVPRNSGPIPERGLAAGSETTEHGGINQGLTEVDRIAYHGATGANVQDDYGFYGWRNSDQRSSFLSVLKADPRTTRFGHTSHRTSTLGTTIRQSTSAPSWPNNESGVSGQDNWRAIRGNILPGVSGLYDPRPVDAFRWAPQLIPGGTYHRIPFGWISNIPEGGLSNSTNPSRYLDRDGIIRPGDGYLGAIPTVNPPSASGVGSLEDRPVILNRPFRSVGELGYVFRDLPWKTLDFFTRNSGDLGLMDAFSIDESPGEMPLVAGRVNLNSAPVEVLQTLLQGTGKTIDSPSVISANEAEAIAEAIVDEREANGPFRDTGDLVARVLSPESATVPGVIPDLQKHQREAAVRVLAGIGSTRTWNLLIDLVVQAGRMTPSSSNASDFDVRAERRVWVHLALDRLTGKVVDQTWEVVDE